MAKFNPAVYKIAHTLLTAAQARAGESENPADRPASDKQVKFIASLLAKKGKAFADTAIGACYTGNDNAILTMARASSHIDFLLNAKKWAKAAMAD